MVKKIAFIGITGNLAPFVYNELLKKGIQIKALVRNPQKLIDSEKFPSEIEVVKADLKDIDSLGEGFKGVDAVYLNLSTTSENAEFQPEIDGVKDVIKVSKEQGINRIFHVSAVTAAYPEFARGADVFVNKIRKKGYKLLKDSGIPVTFFHCSWVMDVLEYGMRKGDTVNGFKPVKHPIYWIAGKDFGEMAVTAVVNSNHNETKDYLMQGKEAILFEDAVKRYAATFSPNLKVKIAPYWILKTIGLFNKEVKFFAQMAKFFKDYKEELRAEQTWNELGHPTRTIETFKE